MRDTVTAAVNYVSEYHLEADAVIPELYTQEVSRSTLRMQPVSIQIRNARGMQNDLSLDREGFRLVPHASAIRDFSDAAEVQKSYPAEIEELIRKHTRAEVVFVSPDFVLRYSERSAEESPRPNSKPGRLVHVDYTERTARRFASMRTGGRAYEGRFAAFNIWRSLTPAPQDVPLALCDARTVRVQDEVVGQFVVDPPGVPPFRFESLIFVHNPRHQWYFFPDMRTDEVLLFKGFDSDPACARRVPHAAFDDPACPRDAPARASIEARAFAFFSS